MSLKRSHLRWSRSTPGRVEMRAVGCLFFRTVVSNLAAGVLDQTLCVLVGTDVQIMASSASAQSQQAIFGGIMVSE